MEEVVSIAPLVHERIDRLRVPRLPLRDKRALAPRRARVLMTPAPKNRIMILGPKDNGTYVVEFRTADGEALARSPAARRT